jgi:hypothetical protein
MRLSNAETVDEWTTAVPTAIKTPVKPSHAATSTPTRRGSSLDTEGTNRSLPCSVDRTPYLVTGSRSPQPCRAHAHFGSTVLSPTSFSFSYVRSAWHFACTAQRTCRPDLQPAGRGFDSLSAHQRHEGERGQAPQAAKKARARPGRRGPGAGATGKRGQGRAAGAVARVALHSERRKSLRIELPMPQPRRN